MLCKTLQDLDTIVSRLNTHPEYSSCVAKEEAYYLREEAAEHSLDLELIADRKKIEKRQRKAFLERMSLADKFLLENGISMYSLSRLGHIIEPEKNPTGGFRLVDVQFGESYGTTPVRIHYEMKDLTDFLSTSKSHPVVRAAQAHVEVVRIHPFGDGNGRVARLLQNFCLQQRSYPPAIIYSGDRTSYIDLMRNIMKDRRDSRGDLFNPSPSEGAFQEYVAEQVLSSAKRLEQELRSKRMYYVELTKVGDHGAANTIANSLRSWGRRPGHGGVSVTLKKRNGHKKGESLRVVGDISENELNSHLSKYCEKYGIRFNIGQKYC